VPKKVSDKDKVEMIQGFKNGMTMVELSEKFNCTKNTIARHLKNNIEESEYKKLYKKNIFKKDLIDNTKNESNTDVSNFQNVLNVNPENEISFSEGSFIEIPPLNLEIDTQPQKDLSSVSIADADLPKIVYMVVDKKIELETKYLKEYPEWQFLSNNELNRKTIQIFIDLKEAKRFCNKEQKIIKVPNTNVFQMVAPILLRKGISRIVSSDKLIALQ
tara:strand:+ start:7316 stop:7966 length:651 start_codon:yes stop_codon:yes gene_type:complete